MPLPLGVSGNHGSFSEQAAQHFLAKKGEQAEIRFLLNAENSLAALEKGELSRAVFPIENSNGGIVYEAVRAMSRHNFEIEEIFEIDIAHFLLGRPGAKIAEVSKIVSHPQALKQCRMFLKRRFPEVELMEFSDTASAAKALQDGELEPTTAVIAAEICAEIYGLEILEGRIQDLKFNFTTFIAARREGNS